MTAFDQVYIANEPFTVIPSLWNKQIEVEAAASLGVDFFSTGLSVAGFLVAAASFPHKGFFCSVVPTPSSFLPSPGLFAWEPLLI